MATTPPNPFDPQEVQKYLDRKDAAEVAKSRHAEELADEDNSPAVESSSPAEQARVMIDHWKAQGPKAYAEAMEALIAHIVSGADELANDDAVSHLDDDAVLLHARLGKSIKDAGEKLYQAGRVVLWEKVQRQNGNHTTASGETFRFKAGIRTSKRVDHKRFKANYPEVYAEVVKITEKPSDAPGALYL